MYFPYILHELRNRSNRTLVNIMGIAIGIGLFVAVNAVATGYKNAVALPFESLGADIVVQRPEKDGIQKERSMRGVRLPFSHQELASDDIARLANMDQVSASAPALLLWEFLPGRFRTVMGIDVDNDSLGPVRIKQWISSGRGLENPREVVLEKHFAKFSKAGIGDIFEVGGKPFTVVGLLEIKEGAQIVAANIYLSLDDAQSLLPDASDPVNVMYLRLRDPALQESLRLDAKKEMPHLSISSSDSFLELMGGVSAISGWFSIVFSIVALIGASLLVLKSMAASFVERVPEIGLLKALGWSGKNIQSQLFCEAIIQCFAGGIIGVILGYAGAYLVGTVAIPMEVAWDLNPLPASAKIGNIVAQSIRLPINFSPLLAFAACGLAAFFGIFTAWATGRSIKRVRPAVVLNRL